MSTSENKLVRTPAKRIRKLLRVALPLAAIRIVPTVAIPAYLMYTIIKVNEGMNDVTRQMRSGVNHEQQ